MVPFSTCKLHSRLQPAQLSFLDIQIAFPIFRFQFIPLNELLNSLFSCFWPLDFALKSCLCILGSTQNLKNVRFLFLKLLNFTNILFFLWQHSLCLEIIPVFWVNLIRWHNHIKIPYAVATMACGFQAGCYKLSGLCACSEWWRQIVHKPSWPFILQTLLPFL